MRLWEAIRRTRKEIDNWQRQVDQVDALFHRFIVPREEQLTTEYCNVTALLMGHFENTELSAGDQSLLGLWITENLQSLSDHPFAPIQRRVALNEAWRIIISVDGPIENQLSRLARGKFISASSQDELIRQPKNPGALDNTPETADQLRGNQSSNRPHAESDHDTRDRSEKNDEQRHNERAANPSNREKTNVDDIDEKINTLEQRLSVERLFRQLAKVLHPDREQNDSLKAQKHILMSQCLKAREEKDINTLLSLYCEHVGDLPEDLTDNSHEELIAALQQQLKQLQMELRQLRFGDPLHTQIVERYSSLNNADCERRITGHADSLDVEITNTKLLTSQLDTPLGLMGALEQRREVEMDRIAIDELTGM